MTDHIIVSDDGPIRLVRMNRPAKKNALTDAMYEALANALDNAAVAKTIRCVVIAGGPSAFCAGGDLQDFLHAAEQMDGLRPQVMHFLHRLAHANKPMVAAVNGVAIGIGTTMLLHCDVVIAGTDARFQTPFANLGLVPEAASSLLVPRLMGRRRAFEFLVMGRSLDAAAAQALGLINKVVAPAEVEAEAMKTAQEIAALPPDALAASRRLIRGSTAEIVRRIDEEAEVFKTRLKSPEARAAFEAFLGRKGG
jgi:enoyl-CoA hydratase/carnithine racemase